MDGRCRSQCLASLIRFSDSTAQRNAHEMRSAIEVALACNRMVYCPRRLQCTWLASQLADTLPRSRI